MNYHVSISLPSLRRCLPLAVTFFALGVHHQALGATASASAFSNYNPGAEFGPQRDEPADAATFARYDSSYEHNVRFRDGVDVRLGQNHVDLPGRLFSRSQDIKRGAAFYDAEGRYKLQMFGAQTNSSVNVDTSNASIAPALQQSGVAAAWQTPNDWQFSYSYFNEEAIDSEYDPRDLSQRASIWNLVARRPLFDNMLTTHVEYARARFQADGWNYSSEQDYADSALQTRLEFSSQDRMALPLIGQWNATLQRQSVGREFYNVAGTNLVPGLVQNDLLLNTDIHNVEINLQWLLEQYRPGIEPLTETDNRRVQLSYAPDDYLFRDVIGHWLGQPSLQAYYRQAERVQGDAGIYHQSSRAAISQYGYSVGFVKQDWRWRVSFDHTNEDQWLQADRWINEQAELRNDAASIELGLFPSRWYQLQLRANWFRQLDALTLDDQLRRQLELKAQFDIAPKSLNWSFEYLFGESYNDYADSSIADTGDDSQLFKTRFTWQLASDYLRPALQLFLSGDYRRARAALDTCRDEQWSAKLGFQLFWSGSR